MNRREAALQRQREFAANASHELRTPLTVIGASIEDLKRNRRSRVEDVGEALGDIDAEVDHMTALVEDLLLLARTDSGVVQVERLPVDLGDIAVEAASMLANLGEEKAVKVEIDALPAFVLGDQLRLRQLVTILTDNAIRHTNQGSTVRVHIHPDTTVAIMRVDDEGPGVKPEDLPRIFERFWRADDAPAGGHGPGPFDRQVDRGTAPRRYRRLQPAGRRRELLGPAAALRRTNTRPGGGRGRCGQRPDNPGRGVSRRRIPDSPESLAWRPQDRPDSTDRSGPGGGQA